MILIQTLTKFYTEVAPTRATLRIGYEQLKNIYAQHKTGGYAAHPHVDAATYALMRMPATYHATQEVLAAYRALNLPAPATLLDLGAGTGAGIWAAIAHWPTLTITASDHSAAMVQVGQQLLKEAHFAAQVTWGNAPAKAIYDMTLLAYMLSEQPHAAASPILSQAWQHTRDTLVIIEPGTPAGFATIQQARHWLIEQGAFILAPCGHQGACPLVQEKDWCHFTVRYQRLPWQQQIKEGTLSYEDEPFSYIIASRHAQPVTGERIIRAPQKHSGHVILDTCSTTEPGTITRQVISKRHGAAYKKARKIMWQGHLMKKIDKYLIR